MLYKIEVFVVVLIIFPVIFCGGTIDFYLLFFQYTFIPFKNNCKIFLSYILFWEETVRNVFVKY